ncbi:glutathione peroxidase-family protein [Mucilaginibacter sp. UYNi724]
MQIDLTSYSEKLIKLENYHDFAIDVTNACGGKKNVPWHLVRANQLFIRMTVSILSFIRLMPNNRHFPAEYEFWDLFSIHSLSRNIVESYIIFWYVAINIIPLDERELRILLLRYHMNNEKYKLYKDFKTADAHMMEDFDKNLALDKEKLIIDVAFNKYIEPARRKNILNGREAKYFSNQEIMDKIAFKTEEFRPLYRFFSNHIHSMPFATQSTTDERGTGKRNSAEVQYVETALDFVTKYLLAATIDSIQLFPDCTTVLDPDKLKIIKEEHHIYTQNL